MQRNKYCEEGDGKHQAELQEEQKIQVEQTEGVFHSNARKNVSNSCVNDANVENVEASKRNEEQDLDIQTHDVTTNCLRSEFEHNAKRQSYPLKPQSDDAQPDELVHSVTCCTVAGDVSPNKTTDTKLDDKNVNDKRFPPETIFGVEATTAFGELKAHGKADKDVDVKGVPTGTHFGPEDQNAFEESKADSEATLSKKEDHTEFSVKPIETQDVNREKRFEDVDRSGTTVFKDHRQPTSVRDDALTECSTKYEEKVLGNCLEKVDISETAVFKDDNQADSVRDDVSTEDNTKREESAENVVESCLHNVDMSRTVVFKDGNQKADGDQVMTGLCLKYEESAKKVVKNCLGDLDISRIAVFKDDSRPVLVGNDALTGIGARHEESAGKLVENCLGNVNSSKTAVFKDDNPADTVGDEVLTGVGAKHEESAEMVVENCLDNVDISRTAVLKTDNYPASVGDEVLTGVCARQGESFEVFVEKYSEECQNTTTINDKDDQVQENDDAKSDASLTVLEQAPEDVKSAESKDNDVVGTAEESASQPMPVPVRADDKSSGHRDNHVFGNVAGPISCVSDDTRVLRKRKRSPHLNNHDKNDQVQENDDAKSDASLTVLEQEPEDVKSAESKDNDVVGTAEESASQPMPVPVRADDKSSGHRDNHVFGNVAGPISCVSDDTRVLRKPKQSPHLNNHHGNEDETVPGKIEKTTNNVFEDKANILERKPSVRFNDNHKDFPEADCLEDNEIMPKPDAAVPRREDAAANDSFAHTPVSLEINEPIQNSPRKTKGAADGKDDRNVPGSVDQFERRSTNSVNSHADMKRSLEDQTRVAEAEADLKWAANSATTVERDESQKTEDSEGLQHPFVVPDQENGEKVLGNDKQVVMSPGKSEKKSRKGVEGKSPSSNVQRAKEVFEESRKLRATTKRKSSSLNIRHLRSSGSKGLTCLEKSKSNKSKKKRVKDQAINESNSVEDNESCGSTDSCLSPDLKEAVPEHWENHCFERSFSGSSTEEQSGSISSNEATVDEDSFRELDSSTVIVEEAQGKVLSPRKKLERENNAEFDRDRRNALGEMSPGSGCSVKIMEAKEAKKNIDVSLSDIKILSEKDGKEECYNIPKPNVGVLADRVWSSAAMETTVNRNSFLIKSPVGSDGSPLEELPFEHSSYTQLVDSSLPEKGNIREASKVGADTLKVDISDDLRDATYKSNKHDTSDLISDQQGYVNSVYTMLISGKSNTKTDKENEVKCFSPNETDTTAPKEPEKWNDQPFYTELKRNISADTSISEAQCVIPGRDATMSLIQSPIARGKWQPVIGGESPNQGCLFSSPVTDNDIRTQVDDILCGMALSTEKQNNIQQTPENREPQQKAPRSEKKCKKSLGKSLALTATREDESAKCTSAEQVEACKTDDAHVKVTKKRRKRRRDQKSSPPSHGIAHATKRSCTDDDFTQEEALFVAKTGTGSTKGSNDVEMKKSVKNVLNDCLSDQELSFLLAEDGDTFFVEDFKNGITMYERLKTRKRMASSKAEEYISTAASPKQKKMQQAPAEETGTPKRDSFAGTINTTPRGDSVAGTRNTTTRRDSVAEKRSSTLKRDAVLGNGNTSPKRDSVAPKKDSVAGRRNTTLKRDSVAEKRHTTPKRDLVAGMKNFMPKQDLVPGKGNDTPKRDSVHGKRNATPKRDFFDEKKNNTSPTTLKSKRCSKRVEAKNIEPVTTFAHLLSSTPSKRTRSSSTPTGLIDILLVGDQSNSPAKFFHSASTSQTKVAVDEPSLRKVTSESIVSRDTSLSCSTELASTAANYQSSRRNARSNEQDMSSQRSSDTSFSLRLTNTSGLENSRLSPSTPVALSVSNALHSGRKGKSLTSKNKEKHNEKVKRNKKRILCGKDVGLKKHSSNDVFEYMDDLLYI